mgnify:CR=1 FL=1
MQERGARLAEPEMGSRSHLRRFITGNEGALSYATPGPTLRRASIEGGSDRYCTRMNRHLAAGILVAVFGLSIAHLGVGWPEKAIFQPNGDIPDVVRDWLSVKAITGSGSPADTLSDLADLHLSGLRHPAPYAHPRTPGALMLQMPLAALPAGWVWPVANFIVVCALAGLAWLSIRLTRLSWWWILVVGFPLMWSPPAMASILLGSQVPLLALMLAVAWSLLRKGDGRRAGILVGIVSVMKLFPGLLIPMLWANGRRRAALAAVITFVGLTIAGLLLPDVSLLDQLNTLGTAPMDVAHNLAPGLPYWAIAIAVVGLAVISRRLSVDAIMVLGTAGMILLSPIVWGHYLLFLVYPLVFTATLSFAGIRKAVWGKDNLLLLSLGNTSGSAPSVQETRTSIMGEASP